MADKIFCCKFATLASKGLTADFKFKVSISVHKAQVTNLEHIYVQVNFRGTL